jgi:phosphate butyryltransferase
MHNISNFDELRTRAAKIAREAGPIKVILAPADDPESLVALKTATQEGLAEPVLVGDPARITKLAAQAHVDIAAWRIMPSFNQREALLEAIRLVQAGEGDIMARGNLKAEEFLHVISETSLGLRQPGQYWSHVGVFWPQTLGRFLLVSDAFVHDDPAVEEMPRLIDNAIEVAHALGIEKPRVALLTGVEAVDARQEAVEGAATIARLAGQGCVHDAIVDGPMPFDAAVDEQAAQHKNYLGEVAGHADLAIVNRIEVGHALYKAILMHGPQRSAGLLMGAGKPMIFCSRNETSEARVNALALAMVMMKG